MTSKDCHRSTEVPWTIPNAWEWTTLLGVAEIIGGGTPSTTEASNFDGGTIPWITPADLSEYNQKYVERGRRNITEKGLRESSARLLPAQTVLYSTRAPIGYVAIAQNSIATNQGFRNCILQTGIDSSYVYHYLKRAKQLALARASGTTFKELSGTKLGTLPIPVAPTNEQLRIVEVIETLLARLDKGGAALKRVEANLKRYKAAVLKAACEGKLTESWRQENPDVEPASSSRKRLSLPRSNERRLKRGRLWGAGVVSELPESVIRRIPESWEWVRVSDLGLDSENVVQVGPMTMRSRDFTDSGVPVLNVGCVQWGRFEYTKLNYLPSSIAEQFDRYRIKAGDLVFTRSGTVGRCTVATEQEDSWLMTFHLLRVRTDPNICLPSYLQAVFQGSEPIKRQIESAAIGTTRAGFNTGLLENLNVPLPPIEEQKAILSEVSVVESIFENMNAVLQRSTTRVARLRQSVLKLAFEGRLVEQQASDEPASKLLERIRSEREAEAGKGNARSRAGSRAIKATAGKSKKPKSATNQRELFS